MTRPDAAALAPFSALPLAERLFVRARLASAPLGALAARARGPRFLDAGCGHGLLCALVAHAHPDFAVTGVDPDPRKIAWAAASVGRLPRTRFEAVSVEALAAREPGAFDCVAVADVLYLLPQAAWPPFLRACRELLAPGGRLLLKEAEDDGGWRAKKALVQEWLMVRVLRRTQASGGLGFQPRAVTQRAVEAAGLRLIEVVALARGYTTPHVLFVADRV